MIEVPSNFLVADAHGAPIADIYVLRIEVRSGGLSSPAFSSKGLACTSTGA